MNNRCLPLLAALSALLLTLVGCGSKDKQELYEGRVTWELAEDNAIRAKNEKTGAVWTIRIRTDNGNAASGKQVAEDYLSANPDIDAMIGLYAYNPPAALQAIEAQDKLDQIKIFGFDEDSKTLAAIKQGKIVCTVVQNPYVFGFRSVELLAAEIRGQDYDVPENGLLYIPTRVINKDNIDAFSSEVTNIREGNGKTPNYDADKYKMTPKVNIHFVANLPDPFWDLAKAGCDKGAETFNATVKFHVPKEPSVVLQQQKVEPIFDQGAQGLAISVLNPKSQKELINQWAEKIKVITVDSDAPSSDRLFYLGTSNVNAGKQLGEQIAKALPEGGEVVILVGPLTQANARERAQGVIDALLGQ